MNGKQTFKYPTTLSCNTSLGQRKVRNCLQSLEKGHNELVRRIRLHQILLGDLKLINKLKQTNTKGVRRRTGGKENLMNIPSGVFGNSAM